MRRICWPVLFFLLVQQVNYPVGLNLSSVLFIWIYPQANGRQPDKGKWTRRPGWTSAIEILIFSLKLFGVFPFTEVIDYYPSSQTVQLNISLGRTLGPVRRHVNNLKIQVLKLSGDCVQDLQCSQSKLDAVVVQSRRICLSPAIAGIYCDQTVPAERVI